MQNDCITETRRKNNWGKNVANLQRLKAGICINDLIEEGLITLNIERSGNCYKLEGKFILRAFQAVCKLAKENTFDIDIIGAREISNKIALDFKVRYCEDLVEAALVVLEDYAWVCPSYPGYLVQTSGFDAEAVLQRLAETDPEYSEFITPSNQPSSRSLLEAGFRNENLNTQVLPA